MSEVSYSYQKVNIEDDIKKSGEAMRKEVETANNYRINVVEEMDGDFENKINEVVENTLNNDCVPRPENTDNTESSKSTAMNKEPDNTPNGDNPESSNSTTMNKDPENTPNRDNPESSKSITMNKDPENAPNIDIPESSKSTTMNKDTENTPNIDNPESSNSTTMNKDPDNPESSNSTTMNKDPDNPESSKSTTMNKDPDNPESSKSTTMNKDPENTPNRDNPESSKSTTVNKDPDNTPNGVPPKFAVPLEKKVAEIGSKLIWYCEASGTPPITYCWMKGGEKLCMKNLPEEDINRYEISRNCLVIRNVEANDEGLYTCCAFNHVGDTSTNGDLKVIEKKIDFGKAAAIGLGITAGAIAAPFTVAGILGAVGFGAEGVAAGSIAASIQSAVYGGGATEGIFAVCQSIGAAGLSSAATAASVAAGGVGGGAVGGFFSDLFGKGKKSPNNIPPTEPTKE